PGDRDGERRDAQPDAACEHRGGVFVSSASISETPWAADHERMKKGVGAGPVDWTGISPDGHVITADPERGEASTMGLLATMCHLASQAVENDGN
ncbi:MAG: hypothetical protein ACJ79M_06015, partial [Myxococcales bacterium]